MDIMKNTDIIMKKQVSVIKKTKDSLSYLKTVPWKEQMANDTEHHNNYLKRHEIIKGHKQENEEINAINIYYRVHTILKTGDLQISPDNVSTVYARDNDIPIESYLFHGSRVNIELPVGSDDSLFNYITSGNAKYFGASKYKTKSQALAKDFTSMHNRHAATHDNIAVSCFQHIDDNTDKHEMQEQKGFMIGFWSVIDSIIYGKTTKHWGIDLALNKDTIGIDMDHGHLYMCYTQATDKLPGGILIGIEASSPKSKQHSILGRSDLYTATAGLLWDDLKNCKDKPKDVIIPAKYKGMLIKLTNQQISQVLATEDFIKKQCIEVDYEIIEEIVNSDDEYQIISNKPILNEFILGVQLQGNAEDEFEPL